MISSGEVAGQELPRPNGNPSVTPWFRLQPQGVVVDQALLSWSYPSVSRTSSAGRQAAGYVGVVFMARRIDPVTGTPIGAPFELLRDAVGPVLSPAVALRYTKMVRLPAEGAYEVQGQNLYPTADFAENKATWDELAGVVDDVRIRPATTEIVIQVRAGPGLSFAAFSDVGVLATRILPVLTGNTWIEQPTRKAVWAVADLVRNEYGLDAPDGFDAAKALHYAGELTEDDTFDGALPEVSSYWEAAGTILLPMRADPVKVGAVHSFVRDESRAEPRHVLTRRQIVRDSGSASFQLLGEGGDVVVEFDRDGDPKRPDEARYSYGAPSRTPKRYKVPGITDGDHALRHAKWLALVSVFRGASRTVVTEWDGRLIYPGDHVLCDLWFLKGPAVYGVAGASGNVLALDCDTDLGTEWKHGSIRTRLGREWGILRMRGAGPRAIELHRDDLATLEAQIQHTPYGPARLALADVLARDGQDPTTVVVGDLEEIQATYVVRAALPTDADHVRIEMLLDDTRIWELLGEEVYGPVPVDPNSLAEPLQPKISLLRARCERIETGIEVVWGLVPAKGARSYAVWLSYDGGVTREPLHNGPGVDGRAPIRQSETIVTVIAVAYGSTGLSGPEISTTFSTVAPIVRGALVDVATLPPIGYAGFTKETRDRIDYIFTVETRALAAAATAADALDKAIASLRNDEANQASIVAEQTARIADGVAFTNSLNGAISRLGSAEAAIVTEQTTRATGDSANATAIDGLRASVTTTFVNLEAYNVQTRSVIASGDQALSDRIIALGATVGSNTASIVTEQQARADGDSAQSRRTDLLIAQTDSDRAYFLSEQQARIGQDNALASYAQGVNAKLDNFQAYFLNEQTARIANDNAFASQMSTVFARTDAGTASGRMTLRASSGIAGVQARYETLLAIETGGQLRGAGYYIDLLPDGSSRFVIDTNAFYITSNGQTSPAFAFDGYTLTIPSLRVTQQAILPGAASEPRSIAVENVDPGGSSDDWREIPGTAFQLTPDSSQWSIVFSAAARGQVTASGTSALYLASSLQIAIGVDGVPYGVGAFLSMSVGSGAGAAPIPNSSTGGIVYSSASLEVLPAGLNRRFSLLYKFKADPGGSGKIFYAQIKAIINKR